MIKEEILNNIFSQNKELFGDNPRVEKINVGFTNTLYTVEEKYIIKICSNTKNEENFINEINFYKKNIDNNYIPKLYSYSIDKTKVPFYYEIIEKIKGKSLYNIWHTLTELERESIIKQLCIIMKKIHNNKGKKYDWIKKNSRQFEKYYQKAKELKLFNLKEKEILEKAYSLFPVFLESKEFVLVHNDLHFDNIFYNEEKIKIIDFERSLYAPIDFELDIIYRMIRKPWKFASEETEKYTKLNDYKRIMTYIEKYYPELINVNNLDKRLAIYDINYYLRQLIEYPHLNELKKDVLNAAKIVIS